MRIIKYLALTCACITCTTSQAMVTPIGVAIWNRGLDGVKQLIESGQATVNDSAEPNGRAPLVMEAMEALRYKHTSEEKQNMRNIIHYLVKQGAPLNKDENKPDKWVVRPIHEATKMSENELLTFFINHGATINDQDDRLQYTALHFAIENPVDSFNINPEAVKILLDAGADTSIRDKYGLTPYELLLERLSKPVASHNAKQVGARLKLQEIKKTFDDYNMQKGLQKIREREKEKPSTDTCFRFK